MTSGCSLTGEMTEEEEVMTEEVFLLLSLRSWNRLMLPSLKDQEGIKVRRQERQALQRRVKAEGEESCCRDATEEEGVKDRSTSHRRSNATGLEGERLCTLLAYKLRPSLSLVRIRSSWRGMGCSPGVESS